MMVNLHHFVLVVCAVFLGTVVPCDPIHAEAPGVTFHLIEGGRFVQGTTGGERVLQNAFPLSTTGQNFGNAEGPAHVTWVTKPFYMAETEVTVAQFRDFVEATDYQTSAERGQTEMVGWEPTPEDKPLYQSYDFLRHKKFSWKSPGFQQSDDHPVVGISWADTQAYCQWLSERDGVRYRLPTEAEWELACRAGTSTWFSFGDKAKGVVQEHANFGNVELEKHRQHAAERQWLLDWENAPRDGHVFTAPVGSYQANPWGLRDMHGNAWEWCQDLWLDTVYKDFNRPRYDQPNGVAVDPVNLDRPQTPANDFHVIRGGSWYNGDLICRSANRSYWDAEDAACYVGFRLVREADSNAPTTARDAHQAEQDAIAAIRSAGGKLYSSRGIDIEVRFEEDKIDESVLPELQRLPDLQRLVFRWRKGDEAITQAGIDSIAKLKRLRVLEFQSGLNLDAVDLSVLTRLQSLEVLRFPRTAPLNDHHLRSLSDFSTLLEFACHGTSGGLTDAGVLHLSGNRELRSLHLWETQVTGDFLRGFENSRLTELACSAAYDGDSAFTDGGSEHLSAFSQLQSLTLDRQSSLSGRTMKIIGQLNELRELSLQRCTGFKDEDFSELKHLQQLREVDLSGAGAGNVAAAAIAHIPRIRILRIGNDQLAGSGVLTDSGVADLSKAFSLEEIELASNALSDDGLRFLGRVHRLRRLTVTSDLVTGAGLGPLCKLPELQDLALRTPGLTDIAFDYLAQAKSIDKLRLAHRGFRPPSALTNDGLMKMANAIWLKEFWVPRNDTGITEEKLNELNTRMPQTNVIPYTVSWEPK